VIDFEKETRSRALVSFDLVERMDGLGINVSEATSSHGSANLLAADVSTLGGICRPGFNRPEPLLIFCLKGILSKLPADSSGGVAGEVISQELSNAAMLHTFTRTTWSATDMVSHH
jgi:hypothetical protein